MHTQKNNEVGEGVPRKALHILSKVGWTENIFHEAVRENEASFELSPTMQVL